LKILALLLLFVLLAVVVLVVLKKLGAQGGVNGPWPFYAKRLLSPPEQVLYHRLVRALPEHIVLAQVQVSRVLGVKKGFKFHEWNNRINRLSYDFVVCGKDSTVLGAIELDDKSHESTSRTETDNKKDRATTSAGLRILRWHVKSLPDEAAIKSAFTDQPPVHIIESHVSAQ
jgi:very-short-patch-repair endonuclease